ncbi:MAG: ThuA domain-containing protein [Candidatus Hydrogenedentota bacterium]
MKTNRLFCRTMGVVAAAVALAVTGTVHAQENDEPLEVLMITGGGWHDFETQKEILSEGISERANVEFTIDHEAGDDPEARISRHEDTAWAEEGFDAVLYNMSFSMEDNEWVHRIVDAHLEHDIPALIIHGATHSYRHGNPERWFEFMGVRSMRHQSHMPFTVEALNEDHPVMANFDVPWETPEGELYEIEEVYPTTTPLAQAHGEDSGEDHVCIWVNEYEGVRVFGTTIGHHNVTMETDNYLNLVTSGLLWAVDELDEEG